MSSFITVKCDASLAAMIDIISGKASLSALEKQLHSLESTMSLVAVMTLGVVGNLPLGCDVSLGGERMCWCCPRVSIR